MGWASGSGLAESTWEIVREYVPSKNLKSVARQFISEFEEMDCDTIYECEQLVIDAGLQDEYWPEDED